MMARGKPGTEPSATYEPEAALTIVDVTAT